MPKYNINFSDSAYDTLSELSQQLGQSMAEVVRDALTTYWWLVQERAKGNTFLVQGRGRQSEIVFPSFERIAGMQAKAVTVGPSPRRKRRPVTDVGAAVASDEQTQEPVAGNSFP